MDKRTKYNGPREPKSKFLVNLVNNMLTVMADPDLRRMMMDQVYLMAIRKRRQND